MAFLSGMLSRLVPSLQRLTWPFVALDLMGGGFGGFKDFEDDKSPNTDEDLADDPLMQMDMAVRWAADVYFWLFN